MPDHPVSLDTLEQHHHNSYPPTPLPSLTIIITATLRYDYVQIFDKQADGRMHSLGVYSGKIEEAAPGSFPVIPPPFVSFHHFVSVCFSSPFLVILFVVQHVSLLVIHLVNTPQVLCYQRVTKLSSSSRLMQTRTANMAMPVSNSSKLTVII
jgi:hypothetical protein